MTRLRQFLYRDDPLIREFLGQVEGGVFDEDTQVQRSGHARAGGGRVRVGPAAVSGERGSDESEEVQRVVKQTGASEFERLYSGLERDGDVQFLDAIDEAIWDQVQRGEIVEVEAVIQPTGLKKIRELFAAFEELMPIAKAAGVEETLDPEGERILAFVKGLADANPADTLPVVASLASSVVFKFTTSLRVDHLRVSADMLEGEATIFGKVQRKLRKGETYMVGAVFAGLEELLDEDSQKEIEAVFEKPEVRALGLASPRIEYPAAVLTPIAIYR